MWKSNASAWEIRKILGHARSGPDWSRVNIKIPLGTDAAYLYYYQCQFCKQLHQTYQSLTKHVSRCTSRGNVTSINAMSHQKSIRYHTGLSVMTGPVEIGLQTLLVLLLSILLAKFIGSVIVPKIQRQDCWSKDGVQDWRWKMIATQIHVPNGFADHVGVAYTDTC